MDLFLLSSALTFLAYECLAYADIPRRKEWFRIGNNTVAFDEKSARWMQRIFIGVIVFVFFACLLYIYEGLSPIARSTRTNINIISGFLFGPLFAIWLNGIFYSPPQKPLSRGQIFGGIGLVLFCTIGLAGQQAGKVFEQLAKKISGFKGLGVEVSLSDQGSKKSAGPTKLAGSGSGQNFASSSGSIGLIYVGQLDDVIKRDHDYLKNLNAAFGGAAIDPRLSQQLVGAARLADHAIVPPVKCLAAWFEATADATFVNDHLRIFVAALRQFSVLKEDGRPIAISRMFINGIAAIASDIELSLVQGALEAGCAPLFNIFCPASIASSVDTTAKPLKMKYSIKDRTDLRKCLAGLSGFASRDELPPPVNQHAAELSESLQAFVMEDGLQMRPYFAITLAGLMAQLGQYEAAVSIMDEWSSQQKPVRPASKAAADWFALRARSIQAAYFDEWLSRQGDSVATVFLNEHLETLDVLRKGFADRLTNWDFASKALPQTKKTEFVLRRPGACFSHEPEPQLGLWQNLYTAYITAELTHIQIRLRHPNYRSRYLESTNTDIAWLAQQDLSCLADYPEPTLIYTQILQAYADNLLKYSRAKKDSESDDARNDRLRKAQPVLVYGLELTDKKALPDLARSGGTFLSRMAPSDWVKVRESLQRTDAEVRAAMEE